MAIVACYIPNDCQNHLTLIDNAMKSTDYEDKAYLGESILQELYIEVFAALIPGFVCVAGFSALFMLILEVTLGLDFLNLFGLFFHDAKWILFFAILIFSYAAGAILYRKGPKRPDRIAAFHQWNETKAQEKSCLAVQFPDEKKVSKFWAALFPEIIATRRNTESEYPYRHTREYLIKRGLWHLTIFIPWCVDENYSKDQTKGNKDGNHEDSVLFRSKHYINILKERVKFHGNRPFVIDIIRNEGHIRFLASLWHALKLLNIFSYATVVIILIALLLASDPNYNVIIFLAAFMILTEIGKRQIQKSIHYVRSREVVMVLEKAYLLAQKGEINVSDFYQRNQDVFSTSRNYASCEECLRSFNCSKLHSKEASGKASAKPPCMFAVEYEWKKHLNPELHKPQEGDKPKPE